MSSALLWLLTGPASAWNWDSGYAPSGGSLTWRACAGNFTSAELTEIEYAANQWDAGSAALMRGADWEFYRGANLPSGDCALDDGDDEVYTRSDSWFAARGISSTTMAVCFCDDGDGLNDADIVFRSSINWTTLRQSQGSGSQVSIGATALHEFGHLLGFLHDGGGNFATTMNPSYPFGGDINGLLRPHEDDYVGLKVNRSGSSTGKNFMLSRFDWGFNIDGTVDERWTAFPEESNRWTVCDLEISSSLDGPDSLVAVFHSTSTQTVSIRWWLSADDDCDTGWNYVIGEQSWSMASNQALVVVPDTYDFRGIAAGEYYACAMIDPDDDLSETSSTDEDNKARSEGTLTVLDCTP